MVQDETYSLYTAVLEKNGFYPTLPCTVYLPRLKF
jgi:hypothetical protein